MRYLALILAVPTMATSPPNEPSQYHGISLHIDTNALGQLETSSPAPIEINKLANLGGISASKLSFDTTVAINVDLGTIECRAFKDMDGMEPASTPFALKRPAITNFTNVGSVLCYVVTRAESGRV